MSKYTIRGRASIQTEYRKSWAFFSVLLCFTVFYDLIRFSQKFVSVLPYSNNIDRAKRTIEDAKTLAWIDRSRRVSPSVQATADTRIDGVTPSAQDIDDERDAVNAASPTPSALDEELLDDIRTDLGIASMTAQGFLDQVKDGTHQYLVNDAELTMGEAKTVAKSKRDSVTTPSIQLDAETLIANTRPSLQDISDAQGIVDTTNGNSTDEERLETVRKILETGSLNAQKELDDKNPANALKILDNAQMNAQSLLDAIADEEEQDEALREVRGVAQDIRNK
jgi:hypothetical protein